MPRSPVRDTVARAVSVANAASGHCPGRALHSVFLRLNHRPSFPDTQQGAIA
jgi:hypothetical protein